MKMYRSQQEQDDFMDACEAEILCDKKYCPFIKGTTNRLGACEGDFCEEAWDEYCDQHDKEYER